MNEMNYIKATLSAFGPDEGVTFTQDTWAKLHEAMGAVVTQPNRGCGRCKDMSKPCDVTGSSCAADHLDALAAPVAWKHDCAALLQNDVELWVDRCPHCGKPRATPPAAQPDYAWPTIEDYEKEVGFEVNIAFRSAWAMARTTNDLFKQMGANT
jgi:hypothetical protein